MYHDVNNVLAHNGSNTTRKADWCWAYQILPHFEQANLYTLANSTGPDTNAGGAVPAAATTVGIKMYLCPSRKRNPFSTGSGNSPDQKGPYTDYKMNWNSFDNRSNAPGTPNRLTLERLVNNKGSSNLIYVGEGFLDTNMYGHTQSNNWEENIYSGGYGGTGRGGTTIQKDIAGGGQGDKWGGPHNSVTLFQMCDGAIKPVRNTLSGAGVFFDAMRWNNTNSGSLDN
jgi:hypothetical protein